MSNYLPMESVKNHLICVLKRNENDFNSEY